MYAVFEHKDKQYKVKKGDFVKLPKQNGLKKRGFDKVRENIVYKNRK